MIVSLSLAQLKRWGIKSGVSILDQGSYSLGNFISIILLARWQEPDEYGAFSVAFATYLFFAGLYNGMALEPISILAPSRYRDRRGEYLSSQFGLHLLLSIPFAALLYLCGWVIGDQGSRNAFEAAALALPFMLLIWLARRIYYAEYNPVGALTCSLLYSFVLLSGLLCLRAISTLTVDGIFAVMSLAGLIGGMSVFWRARQYHFSSLKSFVPEVVVAHWQLGKWIVLGALFLLLAELAPLVFLATLRGLEEVAAFKAIQNFILPMMQVQAALSLAGLPVLAREFSARDIKAFQRTGFMLTAAMTGLAVIYEVFLLFVHRALAQFIYQGQYTTYIDLIPLYGVVPVLVGLFSGGFLSLRVIQNSRIYLLSGFIPFALGIPACYLWTKSYGIAGTISGIIVTHVFILLVSFYFYYRRLLREEFA